MSLSLAQKVRTNVLGNEVWVTDNTGAYAVTVQTGGWGAPNLELNQTALIAYVKRITPEGATALVPLTYALSYSDADDNDAIRAIGFTYLGDGHYSSYLFAVPVSTDAIQTLAGDTIEEDDYFVMDNVLYQRQDDDTDDEVTDYSLLIDVDTIPKVQCDKMFYNKLAIKRNDEYYRDYRDARVGNDPELSAELLRKIDDLDADIAGADYRFRVGLFTIAENIVAELLEKHVIV